MNWRRAAVIAAVVAAVFAAATARLFVFPARGTPAHVDAIVLLDGPGDPARLATARQLAQQHHVHTLFVSRGTKFSQHGHCPRSTPELKVTCFNPWPGTTQGEAEYIGHLARQHQWKSVALVTVAAQDTRARLRVGRCFGGSVYVVTASLPAGQWPYEIAYEWGATLKALLLQRKC